MSKKSWLTKWLRSVSSPSITRSMLVGRLQWTTANTQIVISLIALGLGASVAAFPADDKPQPAALVHFRFNGNAKNEVKDGAQFELKNTAFRDDALYLNGKYEFNGGQDGYRAVCNTPTFSYTAFTVALRFKAEQFSEIKPFNAIRKDNIFVGGTSARWFGMHRADSGNLTITLNNQAFTHEIMDAPLEAGQWNVVACGVDVPERRIIVYLNGKNVDDFELPKDFKLEVIGSVFEERDKNWSFTNLGNGNVFHGLVDELIIHNRLLTHYEFGKIPLKTFTVTKANDADPQTVLNEASTLARQGKYEDALQKHIWFHENALKHQPSMSGVRLSFALSYWIELGEKYPKAREALVSIRDKDTKEITEGRGSFNLFHDVTAINRSLKEEPKTVALFKTLHEKYPDLAKRCYHVAETYLAARGEYKLCISYIPDPLKKFDGIRQMRELQLKLDKDNSKLLTGFAENSFVEETCRLIAILVGTDRKQDAEKVRERALAVRDDPAIREAVEKAEQDHDKKAN